MGKEKKGKHKIFGAILSFLRCLAWSVLVVLIIFAAFMVYYVLLSKRAEKQGLHYKPPMALYTIISPSMQPNINVYDVVFSLKTDPNELKKGNIITFYSSDKNLDNMIITHRIIEVKTTNHGKQFKTKGDNNIQADAALVEANNIIGEVKLKIPKLGRAQFFLASKGGWFIAILIPALAIISYDILKLFKMMKLKTRIKKNKEEKEETNTAALDNLTQNAEPERPVVPENNVETKPTIINENKNNLKDNAPANVENNINTSVLPNDNLISGTNNLPVKPAVPKPVVPKPVVPPNINYNQKNEESIQKDNDNPNV